MENKFDKWLYVFTHLSKLDARPDNLGGVFERLFEVAEIAKFTREEIDAYEHKCRHIWIELVHFICRLDHLPQQPRT